MRVSKRRTSQLGVGLMEVVIAMGLMSIVIAGVTVFMSRSMNSQSSLELRGDKEAMRRRLTDQVSCAATMNPTAAAVCPGPGTFVALNGMNANGVFTLLPAQGQKIGRIWYRAECTGAGGPINVRAVHLRPGVTIATASSPGDYMPDPMTNQTVTLNNSQSLLFPANGEPCGGGGQLVPKAGHYFPNGAMTQHISLGGKPQFVVLYSPSFAAFPPAPWSCQKTADMPGWQHSCQFPDAGGLAGIAFDNDGFTVSGVLNAPAMFMGYSDWVYYGFIQK